ncbi:MAG TPA: VTT domain-containing protein [Candidatus Paceibacterota bacterium]|nr:VTT domain-containing protein [Candidatus Paceibacterota bacterium]
MARLKRFRRVFLAGWLSVFAAAIFCYFLKPDLFKNIFGHVYSTYPLLAYGLYLLAGSLRGFTLIPATSLILIGLLFIPSLPLYFLTLAGILVSSTSVYYFSGYLDLDDALKDKHGKSVARLTAWLEKYELPVIVGWSFFPLAPTDVICYVCGTLEVDFKKFLLGILIGEAAIVGAYIFFGEQLLKFLS